jgi:catechol 2,3-dioxygenase-like lactoylglutathione lyase family enzyme
LLPTGGVDATEASIGDWIIAGAAAVGLGSKLITAAAVKARDFDSIANKVAQCVGWIQKARGMPTFLGVEHSGLYVHQASAEEISAWYARTFGFACKEGNSSFMLSGKGPGRLEVMKAPEDTRLHVAIRVSNFDEAVAALQAQRIGIKEPIVKPDLKAAYLDVTDPDGNPIHLLWLAKK